MLEFVFNSVKMACWVNRDLNVCFHCHNRFIPFLLVGIPLTLLFFVYGQYDLFGLNQPHQQLAPVAVSTNPTSISISNNFDKGCGPPALQPFNKDVLQYYNSLFVDCGKTMNNNSIFSGIAFELKNGNQLYQLVNMGYNCCYHSFSRTMDDIITFSDTCYLIEANVTMIPPSLEFIELLCHDGNKTVKYRDTFPVVHDNLKKVSTGRKSPVEQLNVAIIALDSVSRLNFIRTMPLSNTYLLEKLDAIPLYGYSVLGMGTIENIPPLLTGLSPNQITNTCARKNRKDFQLDSCSFLWHDFSKLGYITTFADDASIFNYKWPNAFVEKPTDYYFRPYNLHMSKFYARKQPSYYCSGPRLAFEVILNYLEQVREKADKLARPSFQYSLTSRLGHDNWYALKIGDVPLWRYLDKFKDKGHWNNTVLMVMGDHGNPLGGYFANTGSGKLEYKLPLAYLVMPPWFKIEYPKMYNNLVENARRLTTPYDLHETIKELMNLGQSQKVGLGKGRGISLLQPVSENRSCADAGIKLKWCRKCYPESTVNISEPLAVAAAEYIVQLVNNFTMKLGGLCESQKLKEIISVSKWDHRDVLNKACDKSEMNGQVVVVEQNTTGKSVGKHLESCRKNQENFYRAIIYVQLTATPHGAVYHGQVMITRTGNVTKMVLMDTVHRIDLYAETGSCAPKNLQSYCICKKN